MNNKLTFIERLTQTFEAIGRERVRNRLLLMSDRKLEEMGFSLPLLLKGIEAWPWRLEQPKGDLLQQDFGKKLDSSAKPNELPRVA